MGKSRADSVSERLRLHSPQGGGRNEGEISIKDASHHAMQRVIVHADVDAFYVGCECSRQPALFEKPVAVTQ